MAALSSEQVTVIGVIDPDANTAATLLSAAIDMSLWEQIMAVIMVGDLGTNATVDAAFHASDASGGSYAAISGKAITQLTEAGTDSNKQAIINLRADEVPDGKRYVKLSMTTGTATSDSAVIVLGVKRRYNATAADDLSTVDEIVS